MTAGIINYFYFSLNQNLEYQTADRFSDAGKRNTHTHTFTGSWLGRENDDPSYHPSPVLPLLPHQNIVPF